MNNKFMGRAAMNECPHKTVSRFYDSNEASLWRCDWCGAEFRAVDNTSNMVELREVSTAAKSEPTDVEPIVNSDLAETPWPALPRKRKAQNVS